jgi:hypothetical protein
VLRWLILQRGAGMPAGLLGGCCVVVLIVVQGGGAQNGTAGAIMQQAGVKNTRGCVKGTP